jgi:hypothetical protein
MLKKVKDLIKTKVFWPKKFLSATLRSYKYSQNYVKLSAANTLSRDSEVNISTSGNSASLSQTENPLKSYFDSRNEGRGIWKWEHYFDVYARHLSQFRGRKVNILEIGIYSGGSLEMWRDYFGKDCCIYGVDIVDSCKVYENEWTKVFIGDQSDRQFWKRFKAEVSHIDIIIDDGGHHPEQQIVTLEEMLPHLSSGGVYICEDVHGENWFSAYISGLAHKLNSWDGYKFDEIHRSISSHPTKFQAAIHSIHQYPYITVIEKNTTEPKEFIAPKHGTEWQPFLK